MTNKFILEAYIKERIPGVIRYGLCVLILFVLAGLYGYEYSVRNMSYGLFLILFFGCVYGVYDFFRYKKKCVELAELVLIAGEREPHLPSPRSLPEKIYQELISEEEKEKRGFITEYDVKKKDMADYYTMWTHQIKTPIAAMHLILEDEDDAVNQKASSWAEQDANRQIKKLAGEELFKIEQYAEMALHYARLESLSSDLLFKQQDIYEIAKQAVKKYAVLFIGSGLTFSMEEFECQAVTDEKWVSFVLEQILSNALKYTKKGGISIYGADVAGNKKSGKTSYIVIEDTGIGIRREDLPRIFERGFTGCNGRMEKKSTGIGLYLCRQIMDRLGHTILVVSEEGRGTKVLLGFEQEKENP